MVSESLNFEDHLDVYKRLFACEQEPSQFAIKKAHYTHALVVFNPLRDLGLETIQLSERLKSNDAATFLKYGASRRLLAIWYSYRSITFIANAERTNPLTEDESHELNKDINLIYMHLRGVLDNYAWAYCYEKEPAMLLDKNGETRKDVALFNKNFTSKSKNQAIWDELDAHRGWYNELKDKRDPVAHRIPLYVVPSIITPAEHQEYQKLEQEHNKAFAKLDFEKVEAISQNQRALGTFSMLFAHNPYEKPLPIYPTIPSDMANLIKIQKTVLKYLL